MKNTLLRLQSIFSANLPTFMWAFAITLLIHFGVYLAVINLPPSLALNSIGYIKPLLAFALALVFLLPILSYAIQQVSRLSNGITDVRIDTKVMKHNLFIAAGVCWAGLGILLTVLFLHHYGVLDYLVILAAACTVAAWSFICRLLISYVTSL